MQNPAQCKKRPLPPKKNILPPNSTEINYLVQVSENRKKIKGFWLDGALGRKVLYWWAVKVILPSWKCLSQALNPIPRGWTKKSEYWRRKGTYIIGKCSQSDPKETFSSFAGLSVPVYIYISIQVRLVNFGRHATDLNLKTKREKPYLNSQMASNAGLQTQPLT